jgi:hypothetical protein
VKVPGHVTQHQFKNIKREHLKEFISWFRESEVGIEVENPNH